jgi:hypothetical protein
MGEVCSALMYGIGDAGEAVVGDVSDGSSYPTQG